MIGIERRVQISSMKDQIEKQIIVRVPASSGNLGPGFDTLGLALGLYSEITFTLLKTDDQSIPIISVVGDEKVDLSADKTNLAYIVFKDLWRGDSESFNRARLQIATDIPLGRGLGSSATAVLAGAAGAHELAGHAFDRSALLAECVRYESSADNLSASLFGGLTICARSAHNKQILSDQLVWPENWDTTVVVPKYRLSTQKSRSVLPGSVRIADAVTNIQNVAMLISAIYNKNEERAREALFDTLHEPFRLSLVPELGTVRRLLKNAPIIGCVLSGAGSSILVIHSSKYAAEVLEILTNWSAAQPEPPDVLNLKVDRHGLKCRSAEV